MWQKLALSSLVLAIASGCGSSSTKPAAPVPSAEPPASGSPAPSPDTAVTSPEAPAGSAAAPGSASSDQTATHWATRDTGVKVPDDWRKCAANDECELVQTTCCDVCNGGKVAAVNKSKSADVKKKYPSKCKPKEACTERGCQTQAACEKNLCVLQWESGPL